MANVHTFDIGDIKKLLGGLPEDLMKDIGQGIVETQSRRIRGESLTRDGETIDPNAAGWHKAKVEGDAEKPVFPLINTGEMMRINSWKANAKKSIVTIELSSEHHEKIDNIDDIASSQGLNWLDAFGIGEQELQTIIMELNRWVDRTLGIEDPPRKFE